MEPNLIDPRKNYFFYGVIVAASGFIIWMIGFGVYGTFGIFFKPMLTEFGWSRADTILAHSLGSLTMVLMSIVAGWVTDRLGPQIVVPGFGAFLGISCLLMSKVNTLWHLYLYHGVLSAIGLSVTATPVMATVARWFVNKRGLMIGIVQAGLGLGGLIIAPLTGGLITAYGWRSTYQVLGIISLVGIILPGLFLRRDPAAMGQYPDGMAGNPSVGDTQVPGRLREAPAALRSIIFTRQFLTIAGLYAIFGFCRSTFTAHIVAHVHDLGFSLTDASNVLAVLMVSSIVGRIGMGRFADSVGNRPTFMLSYAATALSLLWIISAKELWSLYLFAFLFGFGWGAQAVLRFGITAEAFGLASLGLIMGILSIGEAISAALGTYYAGLIFDVMGHYQPVFWMGIVLSVTGIVLTGFLRPINKSN